MSSAIDVDPVAHLLSTRTDLVLNDGVLHTRVHGRWIDVTRHALAQFHERLDKRTRDLFPHLDLENPLHRVAAVYALLQDSEPGTTQNRRQQIVTAFRSSGWYFVLEGADGLVVVTCYRCKGTFHQEKETKEK